MEEAASPARNWGTPPRPQLHPEGKVPDSQETSIFSGWAWLPLRPHPLPELWAQVGDGSPLTPSRLGSG